MATQQLNPDASSKVLERLRGKHVLITGTTGFLGKVVLEKLIRAVPDIGGIHLLIRETNVTPMRGIVFLRRSPRRQSSIVCGRTTTRLSKPSLKIVCIA